MPESLPANVDYDSKDNLLRARFRGRFIGLDTSSALPYMDLMGLRIAENCNIEQDGSISKREGYTELLTNPWTDYSIRQGLEFLFGTTTELLVSGNKSVPNSGALGRVNAGFASVTDINTGLDNQRPSLFAFDELCFYYNGADDFLYDGATTRQIGITPPVNAPTNGGAVAGSLTAAFNYLYAYTYYNSVTGAESSPSPVSTAFTGNTGYVVNVTPGDPTTADTIRLYRTFGNGPVLFLDNTGAIGALTINSTQADAGLGKQIEEDNTRPGVWGNFKYGIVWENRVVLTGLGSNQNRCHISAIYSEGPKPESFPADKFVDCQSLNGILDSNIGLGIAGDTCLILKRESLGRIEKIGVDTTTQSFDPVVFSYREISRSVTGLSHWAACNVYGEWVWMGKDNIYACDGTQVRPIANRITESIKALNLRPDSEFSGFNDTVEKRVYFSIKTSPGQSEPDLVIVGDYHDYPEFYWTVYSKGPNALTHPGISAGCLFETKDFDSTRRVLFGNTSYNGQLYWMNNGDSDNGLGIYFKVRFAPVNYGFDEEEKLFISDIIRAKGSSADYNLTVRSFYEYSNTPEEEQQISLLSPGSIWGLFIWGIGLWSTNNPLTLKHHCHKKAYNKQLEIENLNAEQPIYFYMYATEGRPTYFRG